MYIQSGHHHSYYNMAVRYGSFFYTQIFRLLPISWCWGWNERENWAFLSNVDVVGCTGITLFVSFRVIFKFTKMANDWSAEELEAVLYAPEVEQAISEASVG